MPLDHHSYSSPDRGQAGVLVAGASSQSGLEQLPSEGPELTGLPALNGITCEV